MSQERQHLPLAPDSMETHVREVFPTGIAPEQFAAKDGTGWMDFTFHEYRFKDPELDSWIHAVGKIITDPLRLEEVQREHLTPEEFEAIRNYQQDHDLIDDPDP